MHQLKQEISDFLTLCNEQRGLSANTLMGYRQDLATFARFWKGSAENDDVSQEALLEYLRYLRVTKEHKPATVRRRIVTLRKFFDWRSIRIGAPNPFQGLELDLRIPKRLPRPVDRPTLQMVLRHSRPLFVANVDPNHAQTLPPSPRQVTGLATRVLLTTGLRIGELTNLQLRDISGAGTRIRVIGKGDRERVVYVTNERLLLDFRSYWQWRFDDGTPTDYLFLNSRGQRLTEAAFRKRLRTTSKALRLAEHLTPHQFRHSAATLLIEEGVDMRIVQRLLGHASIATTELYTAVSDNSLVTAIERADILAKVDSQLR